MPDRKSTETPASERWEFVEGAPDYQVSTLGRVRSRLRRNGRGGRMPEGEWRVVRGNENSNGYRRVTLRLADGTRRQALVHRLVLETFVGPCPEGLESRHLDGKKTDNRLDKLAWGTPAQNAADRARHGTQVGGEDHAFSKLTADQVRLLRRLSLSPRSQARLAREMGASGSAVGHARDLETWRSVPDDGVRLRFSMAILEAHRERLGLSQAELTRRAGGSSGLLSAIRHGRKQASWHTVCRLAAALGVEPEALCEECQQQAIAAGGEAGEGGAHSG